MHAKEKINKVLNDFFHNKVANILKTFLMNFWLFWIECRIETSEANIISRAAWKLLRNSRKINMDKEYIKKIISELIAWNGIVMGRRNISWYIVEIEINKYFYPHGCFTAYFFGSIQRAIQFNSITEWNYHWHPFSVVVVYQLFSPFAQRFLRSFKKRDCLYL